MRVASTKLTNPEWETLPARCNEGGMSIAEYLRNLIRGDSVGKALPSEGVEDVKAPVASQPTSASNSGLSRLFGTKISRDKEGEQDGLNEFIFSYHSQQWYEKFEETGLWGGWLEFLLLKRNPSFFFSRFITQFAMSLFLQMCFSIFMSSKNCAAYKTNEICCRGADIIEFAMSGHDQLLHLPFFDSIGFKSLIGAL